MRIEERIDANEWVAGCERFTRNRLLRAHDRTDRECAKTAIAPGADSLAGGKG